MGKIKAFLERLPWLDKALRIIYIPLATKYIDFRQYLRRNKLGDWWVERGGNWLSEGWDSLDHAHRAYLIKKIATFSPVSSIFEIGCASGVNLYLLSKQFPDIELRGIDINLQAVAEGKQRFTQGEIPNVKLSLGRAEDLSIFEAKSFDVVFTDAVLIYISKDTIYKVIGDMFRLARKGLVLVELHDFEGRRNDRQGLGFFTRGLWVRDYVALLKQFIPEVQILITKVTEEIWPDKGWGKYGAIIEVKL